MTWCCKKAPTSLGRFTCVILFSLEIGLTLGCVEVQEIETNLMFEGVGCSGEVEPMEPLFTADTHVVELFELTSTSIGSTDCNNCVLSGSGCEPPQRRCRCGPLSEVLPMEDPPQIVGTRFSDVPNYSHYCLRYIALETVSPPTDGPVVDCDCLPLETVQSQAVFCSSSHVFKINETSEPELGGDLMLFMSGGCEGSTEFESCFGNRWY